MRLVVVLLAAILACTLARADEPELILKSGHFDCPAAQAGALDAMADAADPEQLQAAFRDAIVRGRCGGALRSSVAVTQVRSVRTRGGHEYSCYHEPDLGEGAEFCTLSVFVTTIAAEVARRRGDYTVTREDAKSLQAECNEGGTVFIEKHEDRWSRAELVFPKRLEPQQRDVAPDRESALRDGCRGVDYLR